MLLFIQIPAGLIILIVILYLVGLAMSINKTDKSFFAVMSRGIKGSGLFILISIVIGLGTYFFKEYNDPEAELKISTVQRATRAGIDGLEIQIGGQFKKLGKGDINIVAIQ